MNLKDLQNKHSKNINEEIMTLRTGQDSISKMGKIKRLDAIQK